MSEQLKETTEKENSSTEESVKKEDDSSTETASNDSNKDENTSENNNAKNPIRKLINKVKSDITKTYNKIKDVLITIRDIVIITLLISLALLIPFLNIDSISSFFNSSDHVVFVEKRTDNGCSELISSEGIGYCVQDNTFNIVELNKPYEIFKGQYEYVIREGVFE